MKRFILPAIGILAAVWATYSVVRTQPRRAPTDPPAPPPISDFKDTVAAVGLDRGEHREHLDRHAAGRRRGEGLRDGRPDRRSAAIRCSSWIRDSCVPTSPFDSRPSLVARARARVADARLADLQRQLEFAEQVKDKRAISAEELTRRRSAVETARAELDEVRSEIAAAESQVQSVQVDLDRSIVRAPLAAEVLQVKVRVGEFAPAAVTANPLILLGRSKPLHVRVDVDEHEAWRVREGAHADRPRPRQRGPEAPLQFVRFEPFVVPKRSLTGDSTERVDTRVLQVIYRVERNDVPLFVGQQLDVFIDAARPGGGGQ